MSRIRREGFVLHVGDEHIDVDELRSWGNQTRQLLPMLWKLEPPVTEEECEWLARGHSYGHIEPLQLRVACLLARAAILRRARTLNASG